jgi:hypothetical protein
MVNEIYTSLACRTVRKIGRIGDQIEDEIKKDIGM